MYIHTRISAYICVVLRMCGCARAYMSRGEGLGFSVMYVDRRTLHVFGILLGIWRCKAVLLLGRVSVLSGRRGGGDCSSSLYPKEIWSRMFSRCTSLSSVSGSVEVCTCTRISKVVMAGDCTTMAVQ